MHEFIITSSLNLSLFIIRISGDLSVLRKTIFSYDQVISNLSPMKWRMKWQWVLTTLN